MCAEVLVPERVPIEDIRGVYVSNEKTLEECQEAGLETKFKVSEYLFFRGPR